jgi:flagellar assembly protein FliH
MTMSEPVIHPVSIIAAFKSSRGFVPTHRAQAHNEDAARDDDYARGLADGQQIADAAFETERVALQKLLFNAEALRPDDNEELAFLLRETVMRLVRKIVGEVSTDTQFLDQQIQQALSCLTEADNARTLLLHPEDIELLADAKLPLSVKADSDLPRGAVRIACSDGWIEHGTGFSLDRLNEQLSATGGQA